RPLAQTARFMRTEMVDVLSSDYIELARSKGESRWQVVAKHALRNSMIPIVTIIGPMAVDLMVGSLVVENICHSRNRGTICQVHHNERLSGHHGLNDSLQCDVNG
ncbi:dipeptide/oligopeptide/nickel ABC transporter permease, partial [Lacticaseibacillus rhamnosus MTCC 5462]